MKQIFLWALPGIVTLFTACHSDSDNYFTTATITVAAGDTVQIERIQATATLTNLNTKQTITSTNFNGSSVNVEVLRGAYQVSIQGLVRYTDAAHAVHTRQFRATGTYADFTTERAATTLNLLFMD